MSFYSSGRLPNYPGPITGNPLTGLCEKACISTKKVFDICIKQLQESEVLVNAHDFKPKNPTCPLTFVSAETTSSHAEVKNLNVTRLSDRDCFARVTADIVVPVTITYTDANGVEGTAKAKIVVAEDCILYIPQESVIPYDIEATAGLSTLDGEYVGDKEFCLDFCLSIILKVVVEAEIIVPSYGYCPIPVCQEFTEDACSGFFDLPLFPQQEPVQSCNV